MFGFQWHLTDLCNRRCRHCYQDNFEKIEQTNIATYKKLADSIFNSIPNEKISVNLTGGEPMLLPELTELIEYLHKFQNLLEVNIITNATIINHDLLLKLKKFPQLSMFKISVESGLEETNDALRGKGELKLIRKHIPHYIEITSKPVVLMMTLSRQNFSTIKETANFAKEIGANGLIFERFVPLGLGKKLKEEVLSPEEWFIAVKEIVKLTQQAIEPDSLAACRAFWLWFDDKNNGSLEAALCNLGENSMALMPDGTVYPCRRLPIPQGNLLQEPFHIIRSRLSKWNCDSLRSKLNGVVCGICPFEDCPGCRALAYALNGDAFSDDPQCLLHGSFM